MIKLIAFIMLLLTQMNLVHAANEQPNILLIVLDDWGWRDAGFMDNAFIETPTLDNMAREGLVFKHAYANAPNCAASRAAIMSGQYAPRTNVYTMISGDLGDARLRRVQTPANKMYLEQHVITLAEMLQRAGYHTAHIGKWNLGGGTNRGPLAQGFEVNIAGDRNGTAHNGHFAPYGLPNLANAPPGEYLTDRLTQEAIRVIEGSTTKPFFIHLAHFAPHFPFQAPENLVNKYRHKSSTQTNDPTFAAMVERIDSNIAQLIAALQKHQQLDNTLIIVTSDNGGYQQISHMAPLRGQKSMLYEGGIRVPLLFWWPKHIQAHHSDIAVMGIDLFPTLMHVAGVQHVPQALDGKNLFSLFANTNHHLDREALYWYFPGYVAGNHKDAADDIFQQRPAAAIRQDNWKLVVSLENDSRELYNLSQDPGEQHNLAAAHKPVADKLHAKLHQWLKAMNTPLPLAHNPAYDPQYEKKYLHSWWRKIRQKLSRTHYGAFLKEKDL